MRQALITVSSMMILAITGLCQLPSTREIFAKRGVGSMEPQEPPYVNPPLH